MTNDRAPDDVETLLPWHAAGTLNPRDAERVEAALAADQELARRYALVRDELAETIHLNETLGAPSARAMETLFAKIDAEPTQAPRTSSKLKGGIAQFFTGFAPRTLAWSAAAATIVILLQAGLIGGMLLKQRGPELASAPVEASANGAFALIRFKPEATAADITAFLEANKATITGGPAPGTNMFRVKVATARLPAEELGRIVARLQQDKAVGFAAAAE